VTSDLEDRLRSFYNDRTAHLPPEPEMLPTEPFAGSTTVFAMDGKRRPPRRVAMVSAAAVVLLGAAAAVGATIIRDGRTNGSASSVATDPSASLLDRLLYPAAPTSSGIHVVVGPDLGDAATALVSAPDGSIFRIVVNNAAGFETTPDVPTQEHNNRTYTVEDASGSRFYRSLDQCAEIGVFQSGSTPAWNADATAVLDGLEVVGQTATLTLPPGWTSHGAGVAQTPVQISFSAQLDNASRQVSLMQIPNTNVAAVMIGDEPLVQATFDGHLAWTRDGAVHRSLYWQDGDTAVSLVSTEASSTELQQVASELERNHATDLAGHITSFDPQPSGTLPPDAPRSDATCGTPQLSVTVS
jgi:hypothetical protein